jgi:alkylation response protein AidB-like acyl-CoA dehydrogenase
LDFEPSSSAELLREQARRFVAETMTPQLRARLQRTGTWHDDGFFRSLVERGWLEVGWPSPRSDTPSEMMDCLPLLEELDRAGAPTDAIKTTMMMARTLERVGSKEQKEDLLPKVFAGQALFALGFSEPDSGSDVAACRTTATRDGDGWQIDGQKMFTTSAQICDYVMLLTRTDPNAPKHRGLSTFIVPLDSAGIEVQPVETLSGERTNITFYSAVRVPSSALLGEVDEGWKVMTTALSFERGGADAGAIEQLLDHAERWASAAPEGVGSRPIDDPSVRERLAATAVVARVSRLLARRCAWVSATGRLPTVEGSMAKLLPSEALCALSEDLLDMVSPAGLRVGDEDTPDGFFEHMLRHAQVTTIYGGTSEIQRGIIAERGLGLPRAK